MEMTYPIAGEKFKSTSQFGMRQGSKHKGIDLKADSGDRVVAALPGTVIKSDDSSDPNGYGGQILIRHEVDGKVYFTRYAHLRKRYVVSNEKVKQGQKIGESGGGENDPNKGRSTGPHLHFELLGAGEKPLDPEPYLKGSVLGGSALLATAALSGDDKEKDSDGKPAKEQNAVDKIMSTFMKGYTPIASLASVKGLSEPQKESEIPKPLLEDIERIKQLLK